MARYKLHNQGKNEASNNVAGNKNPTLKFTLCSTLNPASATYRLEAQSLPPSLVWSRVSDGQPAACFRISASIRQSFTKSHVPKENFAHLIKTQELSGTTFHSSLKLCRHILWGDESTKKLGNYQRHLRSVITLT